jgi:hypothetical protein
MIDLSPSQLDLLLSHSGYGIGNEQPNQVKTIVIGNESGTGGRETEDYVHRLFNKVSDEPSSTKAQSPQRKSTFLQFINRLRLYGEAKDAKWFSYKHQLSSSDYERIIGESCLSNSETHSTFIHLLDIRPLPRPRENSPLPYIDLVAKHYLKAFNSFDVNHPTYGNWVEKRKEKLLAKIDSFDSLTTIIAAGNISMKMAFLSGIYPEAQFTLHTLSSGKPCYIAEVTSQNRKIKLLATHFFDNQSGIKLQGLKEVAELIY